MRIDQIKVYSDPCEPAGPFLYMGSTWNSFNNLFTSSEVNIKNYFKFGDGDGPNLGRVKKEMLLPHLLKIYFVLGWPSSVLGIVSVRKIKNKLNLFHRVIVQPGEQRFVFAVDTSNSEKIVCNRVGFFHFKKTKSYGNGWYYIIFNIKFNFHYVTF